MSQRSADRLRLPGFFLTGRSAAMTETPAARDGERAVPPSHGSPDASASARSSAAAAPPAAVFYVHGPGGVGKTALLREMRYRCQDRGVPTAHVDARHLEPTSARLQAAIEATSVPLALGDEQASSTATDDGDSTGPVLFVDTFEAVSSLYPWVRDTLIPALPASALLVLSGREPPPAAWRSDLALAPLLQVFELRNLTRAQSEAYLEQRQVPADQRSSILQFAHGHPLALSLAVDAILQAPTADLDPVDAPDLVGALVRRFLERVSSEAQRRAVEACAVVRGLTEPLLAHLLDLPAASDRVHDLFQWLRDLSFVDAGPGGLFPHDIVRTAVVADLRWRDRETHDRLQARAQDAYLTALDQATTDGTEASRSARSILIDYLFLYRQNPVVRPFFDRLRSEWNAQPPPVREPARPDDASRLQAMVERHEGRASADHFQHWWAHPAADTQVFRQPDGSLDGFFLALSLDELDCYDILGTDKSPAMIAKATKKNAAIGASVQFKQMDFLEINLSQKFDAAVSIFDSINYLHRSKDIQVLLKEVERVLNPNGLFIFDFTTPKNSVQAIEYLNNEEGYTPNNFRFFRKSRYDAGKQIHYNDFKIEKLDSDQETVLKRYTENHAQRIYTLKEMLDIIDASNFKILAKYEGFDFIDASEESLRITMVLTCPTTMS